AEAVGRVIDLLTTTAKNPAFSAIAGEIRRMYKELQEAEDTNPCVLAFMSIADDSASAAETGGTGGGGGSSGGAQAASASILDVVVADIDGALGGLETALKFGMTFFETIDWMVFAGSQLSSAMSGGVPEVLNDGPRCPTTPSGDRPLLPPASG